MPCCWRLASVRSIGSTLPITSYNYIHLERQLHTVHWNSIRATPNGNTAEKIDRLTDTRKALPE